MKQFYFVAALVLCSPVCASPAKAPVKKAPIKTASVFPTKCPVTGDTVASAKDAVGKSVYKGKTYYFCCSDCKPQFDADPAKYIKTASAAVKLAPAKP